MNSHTNRLTPNLNRRLKYQKQFGSVSHSLCQSRANFPDLMEEKKRGLSPTISEIAIDKNFAHHLPLEIHIGREMQELKHQTPK